jgi:hypothetical protein
MLMLLFEMLLEVAAAAAAGAAKHTHKKPAETTHSWL